MWIIVVLLVVLSFVGLLKYKDKRALMPYFIFFMLSIFSYIYLAYAIKSSTIETKYLMASFLLLIPLSVYGFVRFASIQSSKINQRLRLAFRIISFAFFIGILVVSLVNFNIHINNDFNKPMAETVDQMQFHAWVRQQNLSKNVVVLTNAPHVLYLRTGLSSLYLDSTNANSTLIESLIYKFGIDYIAIYNYDYHSFIAISQLNQVLLDYGAIEMFSSQSIRFYKIEERFNETISPNSFLLPELSNADIAISFNKISGFTVYDSSDYKHPAALYNNPVWEPEGQMHKLVLDGINQYAEIPSVTMSGNRTIIVVASPNFINSANFTGYILQFFVNNHNYMSLVKMGNVNATEFCWIQQSENDYFLVGKNLDFSQNSVMIFALTFDDNTHTGVMYYNGLEIGRFTGGESVAGVGTLYLGCSAGPASYWKGWIGGIFVSLPRSLNSSEINLITDNLSSLLANK